MVLIQVTSNLKLYEAVLDRLKELVMSLKGEIRTRVEERLLTRLLEQKQASSINNIDTSDIIVVQHLMAVIYTEYQNEEEFRIYCRV